MALQSLDIVRRSATTSPTPSARAGATPELAKLIDTTKCIGCKACQVACMEWNALRDEIGTCVGVYDNPPGAIVQYANGIVDFHEEHCIGCGYCITGCPFDVPRISKRDHKAYNCTVC